MSAELLERAAAALGELSDEVVFLGAATLPLWITDAAAPPLRATADVDIIVEVSTLIAYNRFEAKLRGAGFRDEGTMLGRFLHEDDLQLDVIPADASILGFEDHWQRASLPDAVRRTLPSGVEIRALAPAGLLATKLEAFAGRGKGDFLAGADFEDIVALVDGREELAEEILVASAELRKYVSAQLSAYLNDPRCREAIVAHLESGGNGSERARAVVFPRFERIVGPAANSPSAAPAI